MKQILTYITILILSYANAQCWDDISLANSHAIAIKGGTLWGWGLNVYGQLGDGTNINRSLPIQIGTDTDWLSIDAGYNNLSNAIKSDGSLWAWGSNQYGQLGDGTTTNVNFPKRIGTDSNWKSVCAGTRVTVALKIDGTLWSWGDNFSGTLGDGTVTERYFPGQIGSENDWVAIYGGDHTMIAIKQDGSLWGWGINAHGELGDGTFVSKLIPTLIASSHDYSMISFGRQYTLTLKNDGTVWGWGTNSVGQIGDGTTTNQSAPVQIGNDNDWVSVKAGWIHSVGLRNDGSLWVWGRNSALLTPSGISDSFGCLGDGTTINRLTPYNINAGETWSAIYCGGQASYAEKTNNSIYGWGKNYYFDLGNGTSNNIPVPTLISTCTLGLDSVKNESFTIYPNPAGNTLFIQNQNRGEISNLTILDITGKTLIDQKAVSTQINLEQLQQGIYFIQIQSQGKTHTQKFIKE